MTHTAYVCRKRHEEPGCMYCDGGLFKCTVCNGVEGSLPTDCPGAPMTQSQQDQVYGGDIDYREGRGWVAPDGTGNSMGDMHIKYPTPRLVSNYRISNTAFGRQAGNGPAQKAEAL